MAVDVGITSHAKRAQGDPIQEYANIKLTKYRHTIQNMTDSQKASVIICCAIWTQGDRGNMHARSSKDSPTKPKNTYPEPIIEN